MAGPIGRVAVTCARARRATSAEWAARQGTTTFGLRRARLTRQVAITTFGVRGLVAGATGQVAATCARGRGA